MPPGATEFLLIRRGSCDTIGRVISGRTPGVHLNDRGRVEAEELAQRLAAVPLAAVYSSPLERARETVAPLAAARDVAVQVNDAINELEFGAWTGRSFAELDADPVWHRFNTHRSGTRIPGGELMLETQARVISELERLRLVHAGEAVALVTHADVIRAAVTAILGMPLDLLLRIEISPASVSLVEFGEHSPRLLLLNDCSRFSAA